MTPAKERKAQERKRKREAGLVPIEVWVPADKVTHARAAIKAAVREQWLAALAAHFATAIRRYRS